MATPLRKGSPNWLAKQDANDPNLSPNYRRSVLYYERLYAAWPDWADEGLVIAVYRERDRMNRITGKPHQVDHMTPISHPHVCGLHNEFNLQVLEELVNLKKSNHYWPDMWAVQCDLGLECKRAYQYEIPL